MKIAIRRAEASDFEAIRDIFEGSRATAGTLQIPFPSAEAWRKVLSEAQGNNHSLLAVVNDRIVGQIHIHPITRPRRSHAATIGMAVRDEWQNQGIGSALLKAALELADNWLNLLRLELTVFTDNEPGVRLYQKFGFVIEGTHRAFALRGGEFIDAHAMARIHPNPPTTSLRRDAENSPKKRAKIPR
jgi:putative acetyltransferase